MTTTFYVLLIHPIGVKIVDINTELPFLPKALTYVVPCIHDLGVVVGTGLQAQR